MANGLTDLQEITAAQMAELGTPEAEAAARRAALKRVILESPATQMLKAFSDPIGSTIRGSSQIAQAFGAPPLNRDANPILSRIAGIGGGAPPAAQTQAPAQAPPVSLAEMQGLGLQPGDLGASQIAEIEARAAPAQAPGGRSRLVPIGSEVTTGELAPQVAARFAQQARNTASLERKATSLKKQVKLAAIERQASLQQQWRVEAKNYAENIGKSGDDVHQRFKRLDDEFEAMRDGLKGDQVKLLGGFDRTSQALLIVASAMEGGAAASLRRPSNTVGLLSAAINGDLQVQRANLRNRLNQLRITGKERDRVEKQWNKIEEQKRSAASRLAQLQLAELGLEGKRADVQVWAADSILGIRDKLINQEFKFAKAGQKKRKTKFGLPPSAAAGQAPGTLKGKLEADQRTRLSGMRDMRRDLQTFIPTLAKLQSADPETRAKLLAAARVAEKSGVAGKGSTGQAFRAQAKRKGVAASLVKAISGISARPDERVIQESRFPSLGFNPSINFQQMSDVYGKAINTARNQRDLARRSGNDLAAFEFEKERLQFVRQAKRDLNLLAQHK